MLIHWNKTARWASVLMVSLALTACGGGGGSATPSSSVSGSVVKGPVDGATVVIKRADTQAELARTTTSSTGTYAVDVVYSGDVIVEVTGGTYTDEATNSSTTLSTTMRTVLTLNGGNVVGMVTPLTTMAYTYGIGTGTPSASAFNTAATTLATQLGLTGINLVTTLPIVTSTGNNAYGQALRALSQYMQDNTVSLNDLINEALASGAYAGFNTAFASAYQTINGQSITVSFDGDGFTIGGTGVGGGSGSCGVAVAGTVTTGGFTVPINFDYCVTGIEAGSCNSGNSTVSQALSGQSGVQGGVNLSYSYANSCSPGAVTINLAP